jgi:hypothetical protein
MEEQDALIGAVDQAGVHACSAQAVTAFDSDDESNEAIGVVRQGYQKHVWYTSPRTLLLAYT